jgi:hypothetical protein
MSRLGRIIRKIMASERTMGKGVVSEIVRAGEIRIADRSERVLVAGNNTPTVGMVMPWVRVDRNTLVTSFNLPMHRPAPVAVTAEITTPIYLEPGLLYGNDLDVGHYLYAASWDPDEGGMVIDPHKSWVETLASEWRPVQIPWPNWSDDNPGYDWHVGGNWHYGWYFFRLTAYADGIGETDSWPMWGSWLSSYPYPTQGRSIRIWIHALQFPTFEPPYLPMRGHLINGALRLYCAGPYGYYSIPGFQYEPPLEDYHLLWEGTHSYEMGGGITDPLGIWFDTPPSADAPSPPAESTLGLRRVGVHVVIGTPLPDDATRILLYRSLVQDDQISPPPDIGALGEVSVPLPALIYDRYHLVDDTGPGIGAPPVLPWGES